MTHLFEYATAVQYLTPVGKPDFSKKQEQLGFTQELGKLNKRLPKMLESLEGGGWDIISHSITLHKDTFVVSFFLQRMVVPKS